MTDGLIDLSHSRAMDYMTVGAADLQIPADQNVPEVLSGLGSVDCFVIGAIEVFNDFLVIMRLRFSTKSVATKTITQMVGGVDYFVIGIAMLIFGYGIYVGGFQAWIHAGGWGKKHTNISQGTGFKAGKKSVQCDCCGTDCRCV